MSKTVLITGASGGIGEAVSVAFWQKGYKVIMHYNKNGNEVSKLALAMNDSRPFSAMTVSANLTDRNEVIRLFKEANASFGDIDILVNNAGVSEQKLFTDITENDWDRIFNLNVKGVFFCCQEAIKSMISKKKGKIINISSMWGQVGASCEVHYSASKGAVIAFTKALAKELGPSGIQVNCVAPGFIDTPMNGHLDKEAVDALIEETPLGVIGTPQDVAKSVLFLGSDDSDFITGQVISPNGGLVI